MSQATRAIVASDEHVMRWRNVDYSRILWLGNGDVNPNRYISTTLGSEMASLMLLPSLWPPVGWQSTHLTYRNTGGTPSYLELVFRLEVANSNQALLTHSDAPCTIFGGLGSNVWERQSSETLISGGSQMAIHLSSISISLRRGQVRVGC